MQAGAFVQGTVHILQTLRERIRVVGIHADNLIPEQRQVGRGRALSEEHHREGGDGRETHRRHYASGANFLRRTRT